jgi:inosine-uridine nucleoside N-ribohydrolase
MVMTGKFLGRCRGSQPTMNPLPFFCLCAVALLGIASGPSAAAAEGSPRAIPVILDTDIGDDIDDTWALALLLQSPELDLKLVVGDYGKCQYRAKLLAKFLEKAGRTDVAVGVGLDLEPRGEGGQAPWVKDYELAKYPGTVHRDGVQALIETILKSPVPITLISIGPLPNIAEALRREPRIAERTRFVGMHGSLRVGYGGKTVPDAEWNVRADAKSCRAVFTAPWAMTITPLDTCGLVQLKGDRYRKFRDANTPIAGVVLENYRIWSRQKNPNNDIADRESSTLFDTVAVYLACRQDLCLMESLGVRVTDDGFTRLEETAKKVTAATAWKDLDGFYELLVQRLTKP